MIGFVLSGGGNRGALEVGALIALFEHNIKPDLLVGTSAGALNASFIAVNPTLEGAQQLADKWRKIKRENVFPGNIFTFAWRFITGADSLSPNDSLRQYIVSQLPASVKTFGDITGARLYTTTGNLNNAQIYLFGDDPRASVVDAVMASAAVPPLLPPIVFNGWQFVDGATCADVPISIAAAKGATEIYAIDVGLGALLQRDIHGIINIAQRSVAVLAHQQLLRDLADVSADPAITLHYLPIQSFASIGDFDHADQFIAEGRRLMTDFLEGRAPTPTEAVVSMDAPPPPGAVKWERKRRG